MNKVLQIFNIKKDFNKLKRSGYIGHFLEFTKETIKKAAVELFELKGEEKKQFVIDVVTDFLKTSIIMSTNATLGRILIFLLPLIIEELYQALKEFVGGLTVAKS